MRLVSASLFCSSNSSSNIDLLPDFECVKFTSHWTWTMATSNYSVCVTLKFASKLPQCGSKWFWNRIRIFAPHKFHAIFPKTFNHWNSGKWETFIELTTCFQEWCYSNRFLLSVFIFLTSTEILVFFGIFWS